MPTVNLSRLHNMIKNAANEIRQIQNDIAGSRGSFEFTVFKATTDKDLDDFKNWLTGKREAMLEQKRRLEHWLDYAAYLKSVLDSENGKNGIGRKLLALSAIERKQGELERYQRQIAPFCAEQWQNCKTADYYKSAFTETNPVYQLTFYLFDSAYPGVLKKERDELEKRRMELEDQLATLNQTITVDILSHEEFIARNFG